MNEPHAHVTEAFALSAAVSAAMDTPLLSALLDGARGTSTEIAKRCALDPRTTYAVLEVLTAFGVCARDGDVFAASAGLLAWRERTPGGSGSDFTIWRHVPAMLKSGQSVGARTEAELGAVYKDVTSRLAMMYGSAAETLAAELLPTLPAPPARVLDLGCGSGIWSLALGNAAGARVVGVDRGPVLETLRAHAAKYGMADRVEAREGDILTMALEEGAYDLVVVANVIRLGDEAFAQAVLAQAARACAPRGSVVVVDAFAGGDPNAERARAAYGLHLVARSVAGRVYRADEVIAWLRALGLGHARTFTAMPPAGAVVANRA